MTIGLMSPNPNHITVRNDQMMAGIDSPTRTGLSRKARASCDSPIITPTAMPTTVASRTPTPKR